MTTTNNFGSGNPTFNGFKAGHDSNRQRAYAACRAGAEALAAPPAAGAPPADEAIAREILTLLVPLVSDAAIVGRTYGWAEVLDTVRAVAVKFAGAPPALVALVRNMLTAYAHEITARSQWAATSEPWSPESRQMFKRVMALEAATGEAALALDEAVRAIGSPAPAPLAGLCPECAHPLVCAVCEALEDQHPAWKESR